MRSSSSPSAPPLGLSTLVFRGRYSDGLTAVAHEADVRLTLNGLEATLRDDGRRVVWPYARLRSAQPLSTRSRDVLVGTTDTETATLFVEDPVFATELARAAPALSTRSLRWKHARPWLIVGAVIAGLAAAGAAFDISPARAIARLLPDRARVVMGNETIRSMSQNRKQCDATLGRAALDRLSQRLATARPEARSFKIVVVDWGLLNAFAVPGNQIVLTRGLIAKAESPDEVAGVLAHEMGHAIELHPETAMVRALGLTAVADLVFGSGTMTNLGLLLAQLSYTREAEKQADLKGLELLKGAGISQRGLADFFRRVMKMEGEEPSKSNGRLSTKSYDVLRTHPATEDRIRLVERQQPYPATPALSDDDWRALREICGAAATTKPTVPSRPTPLPQPSAEPPMPTTPPLGRKAPPVPSPPPSPPPTGKPAPRVPGPATPGPKAPTKPIEKPIDL